MPSDAERRVRDEIVSVLEEFQVPYTLTNVKKHAAVMFDVAGKHLTMTYAGGDPRAHLNARADIRRTLLNAGAVIPEPKTKPEIINHYETAPEFVEAEPIEVAPEPEPIVEQVQEEVVHVEPVLAEKPLHLNGDNVDYLIHEPRRLVPNKCLVIEVNEDLLVAAGSVVIVPLDKPGLIPMSREMFEGMFTVVSVRPPQPQPRPAAPPPPPPIVEKVEEVELPVEEEEAEDPFPVTQVPEGVSGLKPKKGRKARAQNIIFTPYREHAPRSIDGASPQLGRMLAAIMYVSDLKHKADIEPSMLDNFILPHDKKQFAARMIQGVRMGLVERGLPLPNRPSGNHVKITGAGRRMVRKLKVWPWLYDGQNVPPWVQQA